MKILNHGKYYGKVYQGNCLRCNCIFLMEWNKDTSSIIVPSNKVLTAICPECMESVTLNEITPKAILNTELWEQT